MTIAAAPLPKQDATANPPPALSPLFTALEAIGENPGIEALEAALRALRISRADVQSVLKIDTHGYVRTLVRATKHYEVYVMAWLPGQRSPIHDHKGSACAVRVVCGSGVEQRYTLDHSGNVRATTTHDVPQGSVACSVDADIHAFGNAAQCPASPEEILVTVHVYAPPLSPTRKYAQASEAESWSI